MEARATKEEIEVRVGAVVAEAGKEAEEATVAGREEKLAARVLGPIEHRNPNNQCPPHK